MASQVFIPNSYVHRMDVTRTLGLERSAAQTLEVINRPHQGKLFTFGTRALRTRQYVGLVQTSEVSLQILPKIYDLDGQETTDNLGYLLLLLRLAGAVDLQHGTSRTTPLSCCIPV